LLLVAAGLTGKDQLSSDARGTIVGLRFDRLLGIFTLAGFEGRR
jgi:hypothetical protein